ncbi:MAG: hypothetical protein J6Z82_07625 [Schwartzia sp.]|nr:hypothetical protein [Schwartzia sp. (in: firmicutes)]
MAKTIKFNLVMDENAVRNMDGLRENFSIEDLLKYYKNGLLLRWLEVREYQKEAEQVKNLKAVDDKAIIRELAHIFKLEIEDSEIDKSTEILKFLEKERKMNAEYCKDAKDKENILRKYHEGYYSLLLKMMKDDKDNINALKADAVDLERNYKRLFELNSKWVYFKACKTMPNVILSILSMDELRKYWDEDEAIIESLKKYFLVDTSKYADILGGSLKTRNHDTRGSWKIITPSNKEVILLHIAKNAFVRNGDPEDDEEEYAAEDVNGKFLKFHGLQYKCASEKKTLFYMEV